MDKKVVKLVFKQHPTKGGCQKKELQKLYNEITKKSKLTNERSDKKVSKKNDNSKGSTFGEVIYTENREELVTLWKRTLEEKLKEIIHTCESSGFKGSNQRELTEFWAFIERTKRSMRNYTATEQTLSDLEVSLYFFIDAVQKYAEYSHGTGINLLTL